MIIGHRGAAGLLPENTLVGFKRACGLGVDGIELDVVASQDGALVVHHYLKLHPEFTRSEDGNWLPAGTHLPVVSLPLKRLKTYDIGRLQPNTNDAAMFPDQIPVDGERIPTFKEALGQIKVHCPASTRILVDIKTSPSEPDISPLPDAMVDGVLDLVRREGVAERTMVASLDWRNLVRVQKRAPEIAAIYFTITSPEFDNLRAGRLQASPWTAGLRLDDFGGSVPRLVKAAGGRIWSPNFNNLTPESLAEARKMGLTVYVWTPNTLDEIRPFLDMKVDGIITDRPDLLKSLMKNTGHP